MDSSPLTLSGSTLANLANCEPPHPQTALTPIIEGDPASITDNDERHADYCQALLIAGFEAFDHLGIGLVIASADDQFFYANRIGQMILQQRQYVGIDQIGLPTEQVSSCLDLAALLSRLASSADCFQGTRDLGNLQGSKDGGLTIVLCAEKMPSAQENPGASLIPILLLAQTDNHETPYSAMAAIFRLTFTESRLAHLLMKGMALSECCEEMGISSNTVAFHMKNLFRKTGTSGQNHLISALFRSIGLGAPAKDTFNPVSDRKLPRRVKENWAL